MKTLFEQYLNGKWVELGTVDQLDDELKKDLADRMQGGAGYLYFDDENGLYVVLYEKTNGPLRIRDIKEVE